MPTIEYDAAGRRWRCVKNYWQYPGAKPAYKVGDQVEQGRVAELGYCCGGHVAGGSLRKRPFATRRLTLSAAQLWRRERRARKEQDRAALLRRRLAPCRGGPGQVRDADPGE